jgi:putative hydrolase of the HAD superfamily
VPLPRAILFDLDDTLISAYQQPDVAWRAVLHELGGSLGPTDPGEALAAIVTYAGAFWSDPGRHRHWRQRMAESRRVIVAGAARALAAEGRPTWSEDAGVRLADRFSAYREEQMKLFPGAHETLDTLRDAGVRLALVTNGGSETQRAKVERFQLAHRFEHVQIEGEHGFGKPEEQAYRHAMAALGVEPAQTWMVGDNLEWEVIAPQRLGIYAIWHDVQGAGVPAGSPARPDRVIVRLAELLEG